MKYLLFFLLSSLLFLSKAVVALRESKPAETLYFYQAYLVEFKTRDSKQRTIAKTCSKTDTPCTFAEFLNHICEKEQRNPLTREPLKSIIEQADTTDVKTTAEKLMAKNFNPTYDLSELLEGTAKSSPFATIFHKIDELTSYQLTHSPKVVEHRKPMADALNLIQYHRIADNMVKYFIPELEKELGIKLETRPTSTPDGFRYQAYDTNATVRQLKESVKNEADPEKKAKVLAEADGMAAKIQELVKKMRSPKYKEELKNDKKLRAFKNHQAVIARAKDIMKELKELEKKC